MPKIHLHTRGGYYMNISLDGKRKSIYGSTEEAVEAKYIRLMYQHQMGLRVGERQKLTDYLRMWLELKKPLLSPYTYSGYKVNAEKHIIPELGEKMLHELLPANVVAFYNRKRKERREFAKAEDKKGLKRPLSETSLRYIHRTLSAALQDAVRNDLIIRNPMSAVKVPKIDKVTKAVLDDGGVRVLFAAVRGKEYELAIHIAVAVGLRRGEICALEWDDVDLDKGRLMVRRAIAQTRESGEVIKLPKNNREREVYLPPSLVRILQSARVRQQRDREAWGPTYTISNRVARHADGTPYTPGGLSNAINKAIKSTGLNTTLKNLRDAYISMGFAGGGDDKAVQLSAGHHDPEFTREKYQHVYDPMKKALADIIEDEIYASRPENPPIS